MVRAMPWSVTMARPGTVAPFRSRANVVAETGSPTGPTGPLLTREPGGVPWRLERGGPGGLAANGLEHFAVALGLEAFGFDPAALLA